ncbi:MAG: DUF1684 domain-containing protein [Acidimicrobiia bacterium]|nr:DUF1684 domain-containing protein [Acidimicrobiia bacterium]
MRLNQHFPLLTIALAGALATACTSGPTPLDDTEAYIERMQQQRAQKDAFFRSAAPDNPVPKERQDELVPLDYYPVDPDYRIPAALKVASEQPVFDMPTSTGKMRKVTQVGTLSFTVKGQQLTLTAFAGEGPGGAPDMRRLFLPFSDATTGEETYEAGRFLDLDRTATGIYNLDFNDAYNPYCAYNATFDCPLPPRSNRLKVPILAGEKMKPGTAPPLPGITTGASAE